jgi:lysophospholipase L1-like esterase
MYYVFDDGKNKFEGMTREQIIAAIAQATGTTPTDTDSAFITKIKEQNAQKSVALWVGTQAQYNAIDNPDENTLYCVTDPNETNELQNEINILRAQIAEIVATGTANITAQKIKEITFSGTKTAGQNQLAMSETIESNDAIVLEAKWRLVFGEYNTQWENAEYHITGTDINIQTTLDSSKIDDTHTYEFKVVYSIPQSADIAELTDIRVGADGYTYASAGEAVRTQFNNISADVETNGGKITDLENVVNGQTGTIFEEEVQNTRNYATGKVNYSANQGETITINISGSAFTGTNTTLYFWYVGDTKHTSVGTINLNTDKDYTLANDITAVEVYSTNGGAGTVKFIIKKGADAGGLVTDVQENAQEIANVKSFVNILNGKKLNFLGDSITYGSGASHPFTYYLQSVYGCTCQNYGIAGSTIQYDVNRNPMCVRYADMDDDAEIVAVMGGTNDYWNNKPLGTMGDTSNTTFYGALDVLIQGMIAKYPSAFFYMVTPPHGDNGGNFDGSTKSNSGSMQDIANAVKEVAEKYSIPVLDLFNKGGFYPSIAAQKTLYYSDGVHLNTNGQKKLAQLHAAFILSNYRGQIA